MRTSAIVTGAVVVGLGIALVVTVGAGARPEATTIQVRSVMASGPEVPAPTGDVSSARGAFTGTVTRSDTGAVLTWQMTFGGLTGDAIAAHIHTGAAGQAGPVVVPLCGPCQSPASGTANISDTVLAALESGGAYTNVHTPTNKAGEIRGQLGVSAAIATSLSARQERPRPKGNVRRAVGRFTGTVTKSGTTGAMAWRLTFSRLTGRAIAAHIHIGARGKAGPVAVPLCGPCRSGARGTATLNAAALAALETGRAYVNVHTPKNTAGEIRGQVPSLPLRLTP